MPAEKKCYDCISWCGRCYLGKYNRFAADFTCEMFEGRREIAEKSMDAAKKLSLKAIRETKMMLKQGGFI